MPYDAPEKRRAWGRKRYTERREEKLAEAAHRREDPDYRERMRLYMVRYRIEHPDRRKNQQLRYEHGLTLDEYTAMHAAQGGVCAICGRQETKRHQIGTLNGLAVDHDHVTHKVRGLLCSECNLVLGKMHDDPDRLRAAALYLEAHR